MLGIFAKIFIILFCLSATAFGQLYNFASHTFTTAGGTGKSGPGIASIRASYSSATWAQNAAFLYDNAAFPGYQYWVVPLTGKYRITATGAGGGMFLSFGFNIVYRLLTNR